MTNHVPNRGLEWASLTLGLALAYCMFPYIDRPLVAWNAGFVGTIIICCSITAICHYRSWTEWVNFVLGCWTVISPYALGFEALPSATLVHIALGICIAANAAIQLICEPGTKTSEQPQNEPF
ncbi:SPW repeat protein [Brucella tritici]|uniref:SPW repeat protein n=1 Tax=Brucella tritici TaxID=94626 RepID=A0A7V8B367_9HYPH|nr:SPW repeat protein [Brucella tritici]KAB2658004.1 SPW repeat protein [Brucella tritici]